MGKNKIKPALLNIALFIESFILFEIFVHFAFNTSFINIIERILGLISLIFVWPMLILISYLENMKPYTMHYPEWTNWLGLAFLLINILYIFLIQKIIIRTFFGNRIIKDSSGLW